MAGNPSTTPTAHAASGDANPLIEVGRTAGLPRFADIRAEHVSPALDVLLDHARTAMEQAIAPETPATWATVIDALQAGTEPLGRAWSVVGHLSAVADTPALRAAHAENLPRITEFYSSVGQNLALFEKYKAIDAAEGAALTPIRRKVLDDSLRDFRLSGAELPEDQKPRFAALQERQASLSKQFSDHVLDATNTFSHWVHDAAALSGLPQDAIDAARQAAERDPEAAKHGTDSWKFTLHFPSYFPVMQYADNRALRETLYRAYVTRASDLGPEFGQGDSAWDNTDNMREQLALRAEEAHMLGLANFAEVSLTPKMADTPAQVIAFLDDIAKRARPYAQADWSALQAFAREQVGIDDLAPWDATYVSEKLRQQQYAFSENEVKQYFPENTVLSGLFGLIEKLFSVRIRADEAPVWHPDVRFFRVETLDAGEPRLVAQFYLDLYAREGKRGGAWMDDARSRKRRADGTTQTPVAYLVCNFSPPVGNKSALLTHDDVVTLFHECGHGLHHMLTQIEEPAVSGINGVEWDAVELPSQFMENFCWEWDVLQTLSAHVDSGESLPRALFDKMIAAKNFQSGLGTLRQVVFSMFDMHIHTDFDPAGTESVNALARRINATYHVVEQAPISRWPNSFSHVFAGGYAAGYYSYKWAEVLSADAYSAFEEAASATGSVVDPVTGRRYLEEILSVGGSRAAMSSFKAFRGREPSIDALLRHHGMDVDLPDTQDA
jgi:oligopeptidase A